jgi:hypothetical protein
MHAGPLLLSSVLAGDPAFLDELARWIAAVPAR